MTVLVGANGSGKTNLLDAIYYLSFTRSASAVADAGVVRQGESCFFIKGEFDVAGRRAEVLCRYEDNRKRISLDGKDYTRMADHVGKFPLVLVAPQDIEVIWDAGEIRRRTIDQIFCQLDRAYLDDLGTYTQLLRQRNGLLRAAQETGQPDPDLLDAYTERMVPPARRIHQRRSELIARMSPLVASHYQELAGASESVAVVHESALYQDDIAALWKAGQDKDIRAGRTLAGPHRDEYLFSLQGQEIRRYGSQGQQKSLLVALKLAEFQFLHEMKGVKPLLVLDDIFDKLDDQRIRRLMQLTASGTFGQIFLSDARPERAQTILREGGLQADFIQTERGTLRRI